MSTDDLGDFFALPPFKPDEALVKLRRDLREIKALQEQGSGALVRLAWRGLPVLELALAEGAPTLSVALAKRPAQRPEWQRRTLATSTEVRQWLEEVRRAVRRWDDDE